VCVCVCVCVRVGGWVGVVVRMCVWVCAFDSKATEGVKNMLRSTSKLARSSFKSISNKQTGESETVQEQVHVAKSL
jgi:hypothetical protein